METGISSGLMGHFGSYADFTLYVYCFKQTSLIEKKNNYSQASTLFNRWKLIVHNPWGLWITCKPTDQTREGWNSSLGLILRQKKSKSYLNPNKLQWYYFLITSQHLYLEQKLSLSILFVFSGKNFAYIKCNLWSSTQILEIANIFLQY